jgi:hypothetical protein
MISSSRARALALAAVIMRSDSDRELANSSLYFVAAASAFPLTSAASSSSALIASLRSSKIFITGLCKKT